MTKEIEIGPDGAPIVSSNVTNEFTPPVVSDKPSESDPANLNVLKQNASDFNAKLNSSSVDDDKKATDNLNTAILDRELPDLRNKLREESDARRHVDRFNKLERIKSVCNQHSSDSNSARQAYDMIRLILGW